MNIDYNLIEFFEIKAEKRGNKLVLENGIVWDEPPDGIELFGIEFELSGCDPLDGLGEGLFVIRYARCDRWDERIYPNMALLN